MTVPDNARRSCEVAILGGGIVGLATAYRLVEQHPNLDLVLLEKETSVGRHQTGHNSGVLHTGLYYRPGSKKADTCVRGRRDMIAFCRDQNVPHELCGKLVVATHESEVPRLEELERRGNANGVEGISRHGVDGMRDVEPHATGLVGLHVPGAGIVDYLVVAERLADAVRASGAEVRTGTVVQTIAPSRDHVDITLQDGGSVRAKFVVACCGLQSDRIARQTTPNLETRIVPFRGEYYEIVPERTSLVRGMIYPVPDPRFPFLGVHFTRRIGGGVEAGPNAVLALRREGYGKLSFSPRDALDSLGYPGFWRLASRHMKTGLGEIYRSFSKSAFTRALQKLVPEIQRSDLKRGGAGVRAQALDRAGKLLDDFAIAESERIVHVINAPSPAATSSLAIGEDIAAHITRRIGDSSRAAAG